jgi:SET domain-containing protein
MNKNYSDLFILKQSAIHNKGVFAKCDIAKGTRIIEYTGEKITAGEGHRRVEAAYEMHRKDPSRGAVYIFELNKRYSIDGDVPYNTARHINHSCDPNAETDIIRGKIWIIAIKDIKKGEEIVYNYGYDLNDDFKDHICRCGTNRCVGFIINEDFWPQLRKTLEVPNN